MAKRDWKRETPEGCPNNHSCDDCPADCRSRDTSSGASPDKTEATAFQSKY